MTTPWSHLPNAKHVERVLASLETHPEKWSVARGMAWDATQEAAWGVAREMAWNVAQEAAWGVAREMAWNAIWTTAWDMAWGAIIALIAYDDCAYMLDSDVNEIKILATLGDPRAILLLPACIVFSEMKIA